jgi:ribosomal protein L13E
MTRELRQEAAKLLKVARILEGKPPSADRNRQRGPSLRELARKELQAQKARSLGVRRGT